MLLPLLDGSIEEITSDKWHESGCETCDYGSSYVNEVTITLSKGHIYIEAKQMYEYPISENDLMKIFLPNVEVIQSRTEEEFAEWLEEELGKQCEKAVKSVRYVKK